mgnify:CR=1 FL=1
MEIDPVTTHSHEAGQFDSEGAGGRPGFVGGVRDGKVRFLRLRYRGGDWDQDMGINADMNMLLEYEQRRSIPVCGATPKHKLVKIPHDAPIFQHPYKLPHGAPSLWHHSGSDALGIKHNGRWVVFYHQGDLGDAWKTGHSGTSKEAAELAYRLHVNVIAYAIHKEADDKQRQ